MTQEERNVMLNLLHYVQWTEKFWAALRCKPDLTELRGDIARAKAFLEVKPDDA